ncbi:MAG: hypothetical protein IMHGJWDQ_001261 [Candidatus Fervidibacter sp.]
MALTREDLESLLRWLDEDPKFRAALRQKLLGDGFTVQLHVPTEWMMRVEERLERLEERSERMERDIATLKQDMAEAKGDIATLKQDMAEAKGDIATLKQDMAEAKGDIATLKQDVSVLKRDVKELKNDMGMVKGEAFQTNWARKAGAHFGRLLEGGHEASGLVSRRLDEAQAQGRITPEESDEVWDADLLWAGTVKKGALAGAEIVFVGELSWAVESQDVQRAAQRAAILRKAGVWAVPFVGGKEWASEEVRQEARSRQVLGFVNGRMEPSPKDWQEVEDLLRSWRP